jgi:hypothetical protein
MDALYGLWEWYIAGPLLGIFVPLLLYAGNKQFGLSTSLESICYSVLPGGKKVLKDFIASENLWRVFFVGGIVIGSWIASSFLTEIPVPFLPEAYYSFEGMLKLLIGGILVGFGTRYANGCTSGHSIFGLSIFSSSSLKATISFFIGGLLYTAVAFYL